MKVRYFNFILFTFLIFTTSTCRFKANAQTKLKYKWFFCFGYGRNERDVKRIKELVKVAGKSGLNGMVLSSFGLDRVGKWKKKDFALFEEVKKTCENNNIELIPIGFSVGYGSGALSFDRNFAAALPACFHLICKSGRLVPIPGPNLIKNGDLEEYKGNRFKYYAFHDRPGVVSFVDKIHYSGKHSIRFENFGRFKHGHGRIMQKVSVKPGFSYRLEFAIKTKNLDPVGGLKAMIYSNGRTLASTAIKIKPTNDWERIKLDFLNQDKDEVLIYIGIWKGRKGIFWIDNIKFYEYGDLKDIVRRDGTPLKIIGRNGSIIYKEGRDFMPVKCSKQNKPIVLPPSTRIKEGEKVEIHCYKIPFVAHSWGKQISLCMSYPKLYEHWRRQAIKLYRILKFKHFLLSMDEIRNGGGCLLCKKSRKTMAQILGDCIKKQRAILKSLDPSIEVLIWSDMLDPNHNAHANYYGVVGDFTGSWKYVPKDIIIVCWYHKIREKSLSFFSSKGFRTMGACYYDSKDLKNSREWLESLLHTKGAVGIMYTSWRKQYKLLKAFGEMLK